MLKKSRQSHSTSMACTCSTTVCLTFPRAQTGSHLYATRLALTSAKTITTVPAISRGSIVPPHPAIVSLPVSPFSVGGVVTWSADFLPAEAGVVTSSAGFLPAEADVVTSSTAFPPTEAGVVPQNSGLPPTASANVSVVPTVQVPPAPFSGCTPGEKPGTVGIRSLSDASGLQTPDLGVFSDVWLIDGLDDTPYSDFLQPLSAMQKRRRLKHQTGRLSTCISKISCKPYRCSRPCPEVTPLSVGKPRNN